MDGGYPVLGPDGEDPIPGVDRGVPHPADGGYPVPGLDKGEYPVPGLDGGTSSQVRTGGGVPPFKIRMGGSQDLMGVAPPPCPGLDGVHPSPSKTGWNTPLPNQETDQQSEHLLRGGRCASCVHAGGLSCFKPLFGLCFIFNKSSSLSEGTSATLAGGM